MVDADLQQALAPGGSPVKAAQEVTRILRDQMRGVIEFGGLSMQSFIDFQSNIRGRINRLEAGPPALRSQQLLGLLDIGVVRVPFGPHPEVTAGDSGAAVIRSTALSQSTEATVRHVVRGHLDLPSLARSSSPLLSRLYSKGRLTQFSYGDITVGSVAISGTSIPTTPKVGFNPASLYSACLLKEFVTLRTTFLHRGVAFGPFTMLKRPWKPSSAEPQPRGSMSCGGQSLINVVDEIVNVFETDRESDCLGPDSRGYQLTFTELAMRS